MPLLVSFKTNYSKYYDDMHQQKLVTGKPPLEVSPQRQLPGGTRHSHLIHHQQ